MSAVVDEYLKRIRFPASAQSHEPSAANLAALQQHHLLAVPFENLDIHAGTPLSLELPALRDKILRRRRGGFCYELNGLFADLLGHLGYAVELLSARVYDAEGTLGPAHDHLALRVQCEGDWLVDVGFGESFETPLDLAAAGVQHQDRGAYRITREGDALTFVERTEDGTYRDQYRFDLTPRVLQDFSAMCEYHQQSPDSPFTQKRVCTRLTEDGRITLRDRELITTQRGQRTTTPIKTDATWRAALREHFDIELS